ncbi:MAG: hypothetical protein QOK29_3089 [Rhodospirillaceae bacterium]|jgi:hypothetical protein|nr:hypothetical protein [Rhodospirillaceae bacterium]
MLRVPSSLALALLLGACAVAPPTGPSVLTLPGKDKPLAQFQQDDAACRQYAMQQIGHRTPAEAANQSAVGSAALGTVLGAAAGALFGAAGGNAGAGAAIGAGSGLVLGSAVGAGNAQGSAASVQRGYDTYYVQCMVSKGNTVPNPPVAAGYAYYYPYRTYTPYPGPYYPGYYHYYPAYPAYPPY